MIHEERNILCFIQTKYNKKGQKRENDLEYCNYNAIMRPLRHFNGRRRHQ